MIAKVESGQRRRWKDGSREEFTVIVVVKDMAFIELEESASSSSINYLLWNSTLVAEAPPLKFPFTEFPPLSVEATETVRQWNDGTLEDATGEPPLEVTLDESAFGFDPVPQMVVSFGPGGELAAVCRCGHLIIARPVDLGRNLDFHASRCQDRRVPYGEEEGGDDD